MSVERARHLVDQVHRSRSERRPGAERLLRYVQYRDHHQPAASERELSGLLKYVAHRDRALSEGRLFGHQGAAGDLERKQLAAFVARSLADPQRHGPAKQGRPQRAVYQLVISPERADGLDRRGLTRSVMTQLEQDAGTGGLPPWLAAEHRNTGHPHVHVIMAARREVSPGQFRTLVVTRDRLARMKQSMHRELDRQRGGRPLELEPSQRRRSAAERARRHRGERRRKPHWQERLPKVSRVFRRLARRYQLEAEREARERDGRERGGER